MPSGRKSLKEELGIIRRYADLSEPYFRVLKRSLESEDKDEQKWAADNLKGAFAKMIPQDINADLGGNLTITWQTPEALSSHTSPEDGNSSSTTQESVG